MPLLLFDWRCNACGAEFEGLAPSSQHEHDCKCGAVAARLISPVRSKLDGTDPGFPDAYDKWARDHEKAGRQPPK